MRGWLRSLFRAGVSKVSAGGGLLSPGMSEFSALAGVLVRRASIICHTAASQQIRAVLELRSTLSWS